MKILIFAGGNGTRLWPVSRVKTPKQFQNLIGDKSLFELTVDRMLKKFSIEDIYVVVPEIYHKNVSDLYPSIKAENIIIEPTKWDTLACIGYATFILNAKFPKENIFITWSDTYINDEDLFLKVIEVGDKYATENNKVIRIGAKATYPETNWGYIQIADEITKVNGVRIYQYEHHYEKPELSLAKVFVKSNDFLWNMGNMIWPIEKLIEAYKNYVPESFDALQRITTPGFTGDVVEEYKKITKNSIDFEILEKVEKNDFVVIPADVGWNDLGDWSSLKTQLETLEEDNVTTGMIKNSIFLNSKNNIIYANDKNKTICIIGLEDIAVVDTKDALLVCAKKNSKEVKKIVEQLQTENPELL